MNCELRSSSNSTDFLQLIHFSFSGNETTESACLKITDFMTTQGVAFEPAERVRIGIGYG